MFRLAATIAAVVALNAISFLNAQTPAATTSGNISAAVSAPSSIECSAAFSSSLTLTGFDVQDPGVADIVFVLDESGSIPGASFTQMKQFILNMINALMPVSNDGARIGIAMFSSSSRTIINLTGDKQTAINATNSIMQQGGSTCIGCGIERGREIFNVSTPRPEATKFMIVLTDGINTVNTGTFNGIVNNAKNAGIAMLAIGVGSSVDANQIRFISSDIPGVQTDFFTTDFNQLSTIVNSLTAAIVSPGATNVTVEVDVMPRFPVSTATATAGTATITGSSVVWTLPSLGSGPRTLSLNHLHDGTGNGSLQIFSATYLDAQGHLVDIADAFTTVTGCNTAPVANAGVDQLVLLSAPTAAVTLDGSASTDDGLIQPLSYSWSNDDGTVTTSGVSPTVSLPIGSHTFTLTVSDGEFSDTDTVLIVVADSTPPVIGNVTPSVASLWPPNHRMVGVTIAASASDAVSAATCRVTSVASSEPDNGLGDGDTANDAVITGPLSVSLRAERGGGGPGRTYTVEVTCTDASGNSATSATTVSVPHSGGR